MRAISLAVACVAVLVATAGQVKAGTITTRFDGSNWGSVGGAVFFDVNVLNPHGIWIEGFELNSNTYGNPIGLEIYARSGTASGFETSLTGWTLVSTGSGLGMGINTPSAVNITAFFLPAGLTGIALDAVDFAHHYTNGTGTRTFGAGPNQFYSNADLELSFGSAMNIPFISASISHPRVWNGTIEYTAASDTPVVPEPSSLAVFGIGACFAGVGAARRRRREQRQVVTA